MTSEIAVTFKYIRFTFEVMISNYLNVEWRTIILNSDTTMKNAFSKVFRCIKCKPSFLSIPSISCISLSIYFPLAYVPLYLFNSFRDSVSSFLLFTSRYSSSLLVHAAPSRDSFISLLLCVLLSTSLFCFWFAVILCVDRCICFLVSFFITASFLFVSCHLTPHLSVTSSLSCLLPLLLPLSLHCFLYLLLPISTVSSLFLVFTFFRFLCSSTSLSIVFLCTVAFILFSFDV